MATIKVEHTSNLNRQDTFKKIQGFFKDGEGLKNLDSKLEYTFDEGNFSGHVKGSKFACDVLVTDGQPTKVVLSVDLSFMLTPFKGKIQETIASKIGKLFA